MIITIWTHEKELDIGVTKKQVIKETLAILQEQGVYDFFELTYIRIQRTSQLISIFSTYEEAKIIDGDILKLEC